jgi:hypothetical protein
VSGPELLAAAAAASVARSRRPAIRCGPFVLAGLGLVAVMATDLIDFGSEHLRIQLLDASSGASWSHLGVAATLVGVTAISVIGAWRSEHRALWGAAAAVLGLLAVDEISPLHTHVDQLSWGKALYAPILVLLGAIMWRLAAGTDQTVVVRAGLAVLLVSFAVHLFGSHVMHALGWGDNSWGYQVKVGLKEGTELAGSVLILLGLWRLVLERPPSA